MHVELEWIGAIKQSQDGKPNHSLTSAQLSVHNIWWKIQLDAQSPSPFFFLDKKNYFSEANMHRVTGGGPLLLQRRAEVMDAYSLLQHSHPALPPDLHDFQVCCLKDLLAVRMALKI